MMTAAMSRVETPMRAEIPGSERATVERIVHLGFEVRADLALEDGREVWVQMTKSEAEQLELEQGSQVFVATREVQNSLYRG